MPRTRLLACALPRVDWSDAYALALPRRAPERPPEEWAEAIFRAPPPAVRVLFTAREVLVRLVGIERGTPRAFDLVAWSPNEVLLGIDQRHLGFRASVLVEPDRVGWRLPAATADQSMLVAALGDRLRSPRRVAAVPRQLSTTRRAA